jgi:6-phosphogluconolactonase
MESGISLMKDNILIANSMDAWIKWGAEWISNQASISIRDRGRYSLVLSGGGTPKPVYQRLSQLLVSQQIEWRKFFIFWGDERCVPPDDPQSNFRMAKETLLDDVAIPPENIFRIKGELDPAEAAQDYEQRISDFFSQGASRFDTILLGLGEDGHTASLFPGTPGLEVRDRLAIENPHPYSGSWRVTLTYPTINASHSILFLVAGKNKAQVTAECIQNPDNPPDYPAKNITGSENPPSWLLDKDAASNLINISKELDNE